MTVGTQSGWDVLAMLPMMFMLLMFSTIMRVVDRITEPEFVREVAPIAKEAIAPSLPKLLRGG